MIKRMFFGFTLFVALFTLVAWQFAKEELTELQPSEPQLTVEETTLDVV
ncbi:hypothetical protein [Salinimicrobium gaetbulicola]|uniref:Uncharacterized protein n=1 Tax=Salinimicrobium gaetbulicola TaxID=999702 RepID=A0ABW3IHZ6_9FLAO